MSVLAAPAEHAQNSQERRLNLNDAAKLEDQILTENERIAQQANRMDFAKAVNLFGRRTIDAMRSLNPRNIVTK
jgi:hypothetical protein